MKYKILIGLIAIMFFIFGVGLTYSYFNSTSSISNVDQRIARFIFDAQTTDELELPLIDLVPGETKEYNFQVTNTREEKISDVTVEYQLVIKTPHLTPLIIELYDNEEKLVMTCDETYSRNDDNELVCNTENIEMSHDNTKTDNYTLKVTFDGEYSDEKYANLVDYINIEIKSYQKV